MNKYWIAFFLSVCALSANEDLSVATLANDPSAIIGGAVNAITGELLSSEEDLTIQGAEPIHLSRTYCNGSWSFGSFVFAYKRSNHTWIVSEPNGGQIKYEKDDNVKIDRVKYIRCTPKNLKEGFSNTAMGAISSRTNFKNNYILIEEEKYRHLIVHASNGSVREYKKTPVVDGEDDEIIGFRLVSEHLPNGHWILYDHVEKEHNRMLLTKIRSTNASRSVTFAWVEISYDDPKQKNKNFTVRGSDGQTVRYGFEGGKKGEVNSICSSQAPDTSLEYFQLSNEYSLKNISSPSQHRLRAISDPCHRRLHADYYNKPIDTVANRTVKITDTHCFVPRIITVYEDGKPVMRTVYDEKFFPDANRSKIKTLSAPVNPDGSLRPVYSFIYSFHRVNEYSEKTQKEGSVEVFDADLNRTVYQWGEDLRLYSIERFSRDNQLLNKERYVWGCGPDLANLICKSMIDADGSVISSVRYLYDPRGNVLEERLYGNLSGAGPPPILGANGIPIDNGTEVYCKRFRYSSSEPNLLLEESDDSGRRIVTDYLTGTDLPVSQLTYDRDVLKLCKTFEYDNDRVLIREVTDDGVSQTIRRITPVAQAPYIGLPHIIEESYCQEGREQLLKKTVLTYTTGAKIARQDVYDAQNALRFSIEMSYDGKGRLIERTNPVGQWETSSYDPCGNRILTRDFSGRLTQAGSYDACHRPTLIQHQGDDGIIQDRRLGYDLRGNAISDIDLHGNETKNAFDALNRRIETQLPPLIGEKKELISSVHRSVFDGAGREILHTDALGNTTKTSYNAYGKPTLVIHSDGASDEYIYNLDGTLKTHIDPQGIATTYAYNGLRQITQKSISSAGCSLAEEHFEYSGNNLIAQIDAEGNRTTFTYDGAGRKIAEECNGEKTAFSYDSLGRLHQTQTGDLCIVMEYNLLNQVIEEKKLSASGDLIRQVQYEYDAAGNRSAVIRGIAGQKAQETMQYDSMNRLIRKTNPIGHTETISYQDQYPNAYGQKVSQTIHTDPMGLETIDTKDAQGHLASLEKRNGCSLSRQEKFYDANGQLTRQIDTVYAPHGSPHDVQTRWEYDTRGRLTTLIEADGTLDAKTTRHLYQPDGKLSQTIKPDGTSLFYTYDGLSNLASLHSSDGTVRHQMAYNRLGHLIQSDELQRTYDVKGRILSEAFPGGYAMENTYDSQGRRIACSIPAANCQIEYAYNALDLQSIQRKTIDGQVLYTHHYSSYDLSGNLLGEELIDNSRARFTIDPLSRKTRIDSPHFAQEAVAFDRAGNIIRTRTQGDESVYSYDKLYQLTSESGLFAHEYTNDSLYNRLQKDQDCIQVNDLNQDVTHFEYDRNGNPTRQNDTRYTYDALDRLIRLESPQQRQDFTYDSLHRCLTKTTFQNGELKTRYFIYDGQNEIGSFDERAQLQELRILGQTSHAEIGAASAIELQGRAYAPIHDLPGNIAALAPLDHGAAAIYRYSAFGEEKVDGIISPWRFSSKRSDASTGLVYYGRRYYMPVYGRWLTPDPAGFTDGMNLYAFVHNDPLTHFDEYGLWLEPRPPGTFNSSQGFQLMANSCVDLYSSPRVWGGAQALGGLVATNIGVGMTGTAILAPFGVPLTAYGLDHYIAGMNTVFSGIPRDTVTTQLLHKTGISLNTARLTDCGLGIGLTGVGGAMRNTTMQNAFAAFQVQTNEAFQIAKNGGRNAGFLKNNLNRNVDELKKGILSFEKQMAHHNDKILDPAKFIKNWQELDPRQQKALINKKWPSDIKRLTEQRDILQGVLEENH